MVTTSHSSYYLPAKPRINVYARGDGAYATPLYTYNPFTAGPTDPNKPNRLVFDTTLNNVGQFAITLENNDDDLDREIFHRSNRVVIELSKDGTTFRKVFKGLVRRTTTNIFADNPNDRGKNLTIEGFSYLVRHGERLLDVVKESTKIAPGGETDPYDRTDSTMFSNTLINNLLSADANYLGPNGQDDTQLYSINLINNTASSPITTWVPIINAEYATVDEAISRVLEFSNSLLMLNFENDQLYIYNPDNPTSDVQTFMITTTPNKNADDADITMYPDAAYDYGVGYDYADHANKLGVSYKDPRTNVGEPLVDIPDCPDQPVPGSEPALFSPLHGYESDPLDWYYSSGHIHNLSQFIANNTVFEDFRTVVGCQGDVDALNQIKGRLRNNSSGSPGSAIGATFAIWPDADSAVNWPSATTTYLMAGTEPGVTGGATLVPGTTYWLETWQVETQTNSVRLGWASALYDGVQGRQDSSFTSTDGPASSFNGAFGTIGVRSFVIETGSAASTIPGCAGFTEPTVNFDRRISANDRVAQKKTILIERAYTSLPPGTHTAQSLNELLYSKLYVSSKPRFTYVFPSVTIPNKYPKAGDLVTHIDPYNKVGTAFDPIQIGIVADARYEFGTDPHNILGLRKLSLTTTGIRKGYY